MTYILVIVGMILNVAAQIALKYASMSPNGEVINPLHEPLRVLLSWSFLLGLVFYAISVVNWVVVLARLDLAVAYPLMSMGYILTLGAGWWLFHEPISLTRIIGVVTIIIGVLLITRPVTHA
jgi:multidrug transporter EmrE-like cation transporter